MKRGSLILVLLWIAGGLPMQSRAVANIPKKRVVAVRAPQAPNIDGLLDEAVWQSAVPATGFTQFDPEEGAAATESTVVYVLYDNDALYVGAHCYDRTPSGIRTQLSRRDRDVLADKFTVIIDSYHDRQTGFLFGGTVSGVQSDGILSQDGLVYNTEWDAVWDFQARIVDDGWMAEFRIPFSALRFAEQAGEYTWGVNFRRDIARKQEIDQWMMVPRKEMSPGTVIPVSQMGDLGGLRDLHPSMHLEILPYVVGKQSFLSRPAPLSLKSEFTGTAGLDLKYGLSNNFTLDLSVNPDFGQVEVDQAVLNLTVFETFYPEKRPFFLEGSQLFSFGNVFDSRDLLLLYSRRIGRAPDVAAAGGFEVADAPSLTKILGAAKVSGKTEGGLTFGALSAMTGKEEATEENAAGVRNTFTVANQASYNAFRLRQDLGEGSYVGAMATGGFHDQSTPVFTGGLDMNLRFSEGKYAIDGYVAGSRLTSPAGDLLEGSAGRIGLGELEGTHWLAFSLYEFSTRHFDLDDLGFYSQPREHGGYSQITYKDEQAGELLRRYSLNGELDYSWNWERVKTGLQTQFIPIFEFRNFWALTINYTHHLPSYDDLSRGVAGLYHRPTGDDVNVLVQTDSREPVIGAVREIYRTAANGLRSLSTTLYADIRLSTWAELTPTATILHSRNEENWVVPYDPTFADRDIDEYNISLQGTFTFARNLSLQMFGQLFLVRGHYGNFRLLSGPDDFIPVLVGTDPDFNETIFNANLILRWEYSPGSTLYLVWTQARSGFRDGSDLTFGENASDAFRLPMNNVLLLKISYWWSR